MMISSAPKPVISLPTAVAVAAHGGADMVDGALIEDRPWEKQLVAWRAHDLAGLSGQIVRQIVAVRDADELDGRIASKPPSRIEDRGQRRFHVAGRQIESLQRNLRRLSLPMFALSAAASINKLSRRS